MAVTKQQIADYLGISRTAVSLTLNRSPKCTVSKECQQKIINAAKELGYPLQNTEVLPPKICVAAFNMDNKAAMSTNNNELRLIDDYISSQGYNIVFLNVSKSEHSMNRFYDYINSGDADALVMLSVTDPSVCSRIADGSIPYVIFSEIDNQPGNTCFPDTYEITRQMMQRLIKMGHRRIAFFTLMLEYPQQKHILNGYKSALSEAEIDYDPALIQVSSLHDGGELAARMEYLGIKYTAAICANSVLQFGALNWMQQHGIQVPAQKSLLGYGMTDLVTLAKPELSTFYMDSKEYIESGMKCLMESIKTGKRNFPCYRVQKGGLYEGGTLAPPM